MGRSRRGNALALGLALSVGMAGAAVASDLLRGLQRLPDEDASSALRARVEARNPAGGSEAGLAERLTSEGFKVTRLPIRMGEAVSYSEAVKTEGSLVCRRQAFVRWRAAASGAITWLDARYGVGDCL